MLRLFSILFLGAIVVLSLTTAAPSAGGPAPVASFTWNPESLPGGVRPPGVAVFQERYALKMDKYGETFVDLGQGEKDALRLEGSMTLTALFQLEKQWPMRTGLVAKWDTRPGEASYELGITPERRGYFRLSAGGSCVEGVTEVMGQAEIDKGKPSVLVATFQPEGRVALYLNGRPEASAGQGIPAACHDSPSPVSLGCRFEGILAGVWFHDVALSDREVAAWSEAIARNMPSDAPYAEWKVVKKAESDRPAVSLDAVPGMRLIQEIDIQPYAGSYLSIGDLDGDGRVDFLLHKNASTYTVPGRLIALDHDGKALWEFGDRALTVHANAGSAPVGEPGTSPALRGIVTIYDMDQDGNSDVVAEIWEEGKPFLYLLEGATGAVKRRIPSPLDLSIRQPPNCGNRQSSRGHPVIRVATLKGKEAGPCVIVKYEASNGVPCHAVALNRELNILWHIQGNSKTMGHLPTVADLDSDGCDEVVLGHALADHDGRVLWDKGEAFEWHADCTEVAELVPGRGKVILNSTCGIGPVYCLSVDGEVLWQKTREEVEHGQGVWVGDFIQEEPGLEAIVCACGHVGHFITLRGSDGATLSRFDHLKRPTSYPDFPTVVNWESAKTQCLWLPQDKALVDGHGHPVAWLAGMDERVQNRLHCGTSWRPVGAQAFAVDLCGDDRDELVLYEPYAGESIFIFGHPEGGDGPKPYRHLPVAYNVRSYF